jgi:PleD family two-component response regulator
VFRPASGVIKRPAIKEWRVAEIGILIIDDDIGSQRALKQVLDGEGWRVRIVPLEAQALPELAKGTWNLVIVNASRTNVHGPVFAILRELALADPGALEEEPSVKPEQAENQNGNGNGNGDGDTGTDGNGAVPSRRRLRVLFLIPALAVKDVQPVLERDGLPYILKPYHLHDFLEKVSELLQEAGAIEDPIRSMREFTGAKKRRRKRAARDARRGAMFASREDYQMTEEEMAEWERQEEEEKKKRQKEQKDREHLG